MNKFNFHKLSISVSTLSIALGAIATTSPAAQAGTLTKNIKFDQFGPDVPQLDIHLGNGLELIVTAGIHSGGAGANAPLNLIRDAKVTQSGGSQAGLGVRSGKSDNTKQLDASGPNEFLRFTFSQKVTLLSTIFESARKGDEFDLGIDGVDLAINKTFGTDRLRDFPGAGFAGRTDRKVDFSGGVDFNGDRTNALFPAKGLVFDFYTDDRRDSYKIREITVAQDIPEPTSLLGLLAVSAIVGNSAFKRKKAVN